MDFVLLALLVAAFAAFLPGGRRAQRQRQRMEEDERRQEEFDDALLSANDIARVELGDFDVDHAYYEELSSVLEELNFRYVADVENRTLSAYQPELRTCIRIWLSRDGLIRAGAADLRLRGMLRTLQWINVLPKELRIFELVSEVGRGRFFSTSNSGRLDRVDYPPELEIERLPVGTDVETVIKRHRERIERAHRSSLKGHGSRFDPKVFRGYEDVIESWQRQLALVGAHRKRRTKPRAPEVAVAQAGEGETEGP